MKALALIALLAGGPEPEPPRRGPSWIVAAATGGGLLIGAGLLTLFARLAESQLRDGGGIASYSDVVAVRGRGETMQFTGIALFACAAVAALASFILYFRADVL